MDNEPNGQPSDQTITCADCGIAFVWTAGQQAFFREKQLSRPKRCKPCRVQKRLAYEQRALPFDATAPATGGGTR